MSKIAAFFRNLLAPGDRTMGGEPYRLVSVRMNPTVFRRLDGLAEHLETAGDSIVHLALTDWLEAHEADILAGRVAIRKEPW